MNVSLKKLEDRMRTLQQQLQTDTAACNQLQAQLNERRLQAQACQGAIQLCAELIEAAKAPEPEPKPADE